jgi:hypothetical protein
MKIKRKELEDMKANVDYAFTMMNAYAKDPWNMGTDPQSRFRVDPQTILGEVYLALAPVSMQLTEILKEKS